jgi:hypothetical protein
MNKIELSLKEFTNYKPDYKSLSSNISLKVTSDDFTELESEHLQLLHSRLTEKWTVKFTYDFLLIYSKTNSFDFSAFFPPHASLHCSYTVKPTPLQREMRKLSISELNKHDCYYYYDGYTNNMEHLWIIFNTNNTSVIGPTPMPTELRQLIDNIKIKVFRRYFFNKAEF